jgi:hypothetical protein
MSSIIAFQPPDQNWILVGSGHQTGLILTNHQRITKSGKNLIVSPFAMIVGLSARVFAMIVSPNRLLFASPRHTVCKPLQVE